MNCVSCVIAPPCSSWGLKALLHSVAELTLCISQLLNNHKTSPAPSLLESPSKCHRLDV